MLCYRIPSGIFLGACILAALLLPPPYGQWIFICFGSALAFFSVREFILLLKAGANRLAACLFGLAALFLFIMPILFNLRAALIYSAFLLILLIIVFWIGLAFSVEKERWLSAGINGFASLALVFVPLQFLTLLYMYPPDSIDIPGRHLVLFLLVVTKCGDIGAYLLGVSSQRLMAGGNHKIVPKLSPKKSWEGTFGGLCFCILAAFLLRRFFPLAEFTSLLLAGALLFVGGFAGDLAISAVKRTVGVKDSGNLIPGMGGVLDVVDSLLLNSPLFYLFLLIFS